MFDCKIAFWEASNSTNLAQKHVLSSVVFKITHSHDDMIRYSNVLWNDKRSIILVNKETEFQSHFIEQITTFQTGRLLLDLFSQ